MKNYLKRKIDSYFASDDKRPLIVDVSSLEDLEELSQSYFLLPKKDILSLASKSEEFPSMGEIYQFLDGSTFEKCFITNLGTVLRLSGCDVFNSVIHSLLESTYTTKFIIITYQCARFFNERIPRNRENIICVETDNPNLPSSLIFIPAKFQALIKAVNGLGNALSEVEKSDGKKIYVTTSFEKGDFSQSLISIDDCKSPYDMLCIQDKKISKLNKKLGTDKNWNELLKNIKNNSIEDTIGEYIRTNDINAELKDWFGKSEFNQWLLFIYLKLKDVRIGIWSVDYAIDKSQSVDEFIINIYKSILEISFKEPEYWNKYETRKKFLNDLRDEEKFYEYCSLVSYKNEDAIYYLTDNNDFEKRLILETIDKYKDKFTKQKLLNILQHVYTDLYDYLLDYNYSDELLTRYFNEYKYLKVINTLTPEFKEIVDKEAIERSFKRRLPYRTEKLDDVDVNNSKVYFVDALGVEFLNFIEKKCQERKLACRINICKSNLPSLTAKNTEFRGYFAKKGIEVVDEKRLDTLIHEGKEDYDFDKTKLPIHIIEEFKIIEECLDNIKKNIRSQFIKKAIVISDHGATRLAILNTEMVKEDVESIGEHGGRVCKDISGTTHIPNAIIEDGYCILADYNSFKGGRVGKVEMHGGATLEEVTVPIIEIFEQSNNVEIFIPDEVIKVSFKKKAILHFFSSKKMDNVSIRINGRSYTASSEDQSKFTVELPDIQKSGEYKFEVWEGTEMKSFDKVFKVEKESAKTNDLWG